MYLAGWLFPCVNSKQQTESGEKEISECRFFFGTLELALSSKLNRRACSATSTDKVRLPPPKQQVFKLLAPVTRKHALHAREKSVMRTSLSLSAPSSFIGPVEVEERELRFFVHAGPRNCHL